MFPAYRAFLAASPELADNEPLCDLCQKRPETHSDSEGIGFCDECWAEAIAAASPAPDKEAQP
jgi:hypothetical protein